VATKGALSLDNSTVIDMYDKVTEYEITVQDMFYSEYKNAFKISESNYFKGEAADSFKEYIKNGAINIITEFMDVTANVSLIIQLIAIAYLQYEKENYGKVDEPTLDYIDSTLKSKKGLIENFSYELSSVLSAASQYISTKDLELNNIFNTYGTAEESNRNIRKDLYSVDDECLAAVNELYDRITALKNLIIKMTGFCYNESGQLNVENLGKVPSQDWYSKAGNVALYLKLQEDPFVYSAGEVTLAEDQWAAGLCSDVYAYAGYSFLNAGYEAGIEDGNAFVKASASVAKANAYAQVTDHIYASADASFLSGSFESVVGNGDAYIKTEGSVFEANGYAQVTDHIYASTDVSLLGGSYEGGIKDGALFTTMAGAVFEANGYAQFTDYLRAKSNAKVLYGKLDTKAGISDTYFGGHIDAGVGVAKAERSITLGTDELNAFVKGEAKFCCADGKAAFEFEEDGQFAIGVDASATFARATAEGGLSILSYKDKDPTSGKTKQRLLGFYAAADADLGAKASFWVESKKAIEGKFINVNATRLKLGGALGLGLTLDVTVPTIYYKWPW